MPTMVEEHAEEQDTFVLQVSFLDEANQPLTPNSGLKWKLTNMAGTVINGRENVAIDPPAATVNITLSGPDLAISAGEKKPVLRCVLLEGTYTSATYGANLSLKKEIRFYIGDSLSIV